MARIAGIDLPKNKRGVIGLTYIFGIGKSTAQKICTMPNRGRTCRIMWMDFDMVVSVPVL